MFKSAGLPGYGWRVVILAILMGALAARLAYFNELQSQFPSFLESKPFCGLDANAYHSRGPRIIAGQWPDDTPFYHIILYPFYLAVVYWWAGVNLKVAVFGHINLETVPLLTYFPFTWGSVLAGALGGMLLVRPGRYRGWLPALLVCLILLTLLFHIQYRFRLLLTPVVILYAAALIAAMPDLTRAQAWLILGVLGLGFPFWPALGWLLGLGIMARLWRRGRDAGWRGLRWPLIAAWSYLITALLVSHIVAFVLQARQTQDIFLGPPAAGPVAVGQSFVVNCDGFHQVEVVMGDFGNAHDRPLSFHLRSTVADGDDIYAVAVDATGIEDRARRTFTFPARPDSAGQSYFFFIAAPDTPPSEAVTIRGVFDQPVDRYGDGRAYIGQPGAWQAFPADLAFTARCQAGPFALARQAFQALAANRGGAAMGYWLLFIFHGIVLAAALVNAGRRT